MGFPTKYTGVRPYPEDHYSGYGSPEHYTRSGPNGGIHHTDVYRVGGFRASWDEDKNGNYVAGSLHFVLDGKKWDDKYKFTNWTTDGQSDARGPITFGDVYDNED